LTLVRESLAVARRSERRLSRIVSASTSGGEHHVVHHTEKPAVMSGRSGAPQRPPPLVTDCQQDSVTARRCARAQQPGSDARRPKCPVAPRLSRLPHFGRTDSSRRLVYDHRGIR
jgi:hypothetical protein